MPLPARPLPLFFLALSLPLVSTVGLATNEPIRIPGTLLEINGQAEVPAGLFGLHAVDLTPEQAESWGIESVRLIHAAPNGRPTRLRGDTQGRSKPLPPQLSSVVDCWFDRYVPALQLTDANWQKRLETLALTYAREAATTGEQHYLEFWNEPYLNWASKPGVNYAPSWFDTSRAAPGAPMVLKTTDQPIPGLVWDREIFFVQRNSPHDLDFVLSSYLPRSAQEGDTVTLGYGAGRATLKEGGTVRIRGADRRLVKAWSGRDPEQRHYWSGPVNERLYNEMLGVVGRALKTANPDVKLAGGWGFNFFNENWAAWETLIKPTIDKNHAWIDALHEHHYGGDTRMVAASYEVAYAYTLSRYGKRLDFWNTEAGGYLDPQQPGNALPGPQGDLRTRARSGMTYLLRDVAYLLDRMPDKARFRAAHQPGPDDGELLALQLLKPLRGRLLVVENPNPRLWTTAALRDDQLSVLLFNDANEPIEHPLVLAAPGGAQFTRITRREIVPDDTTTNGLRLHATAEAAEGAIWRGNVNVAAKNAVVLTFALSRAPADALPGLCLRQFCAPDVLQPLPSLPQGTVIEIPTADLANATGARLRLVLSPPFEALSITVNGTPIPAPGRPQSQVWDLPLPRNILHTSNRVIIESEAPQTRILATSIYVETK